jgi:hypothetical protein
MRIMMDKMTDKMVECRFLIRTLGEKIYSGEARVSDVRETRKSVNSILKEVGIMIKNKEI